MEMPRLITGANRVAFGGGSPRAGLRPSFQVSCHCNGPAKDLNWSCLCRWWGGGCYGGYQKYADGSWESWSGCDAKA